jgi:hypothetical protein
MSATEEAAILAWLASIDERARASIDYVLAVCQQNAKAREYAMGRAGEG